MNLSKVLHLSQYGKSYRVRKKNIGRLHKKYLIELSILNNLSKDIRYPDLEVYARSDMIIIEDIDKFVIALCKSELSNR